MALVLQSGLGIKAMLQTHHIQCVDLDEAVKEDIRALRIGVLNIMPQAEQYEFSLLYALGRSVLQIEPVWIRLREHQYRSSDHEHLKRRYVYFDEALSRGPIDALLLTGAPVEDLDFEQVYYWRELLGILEHCQINSQSVLGMCWGGLALASMLGIEKIRYPRKLFGVFETRNLNPGHTIMCDQDDVFWCPQSRFAGVGDAAMEAAASRGDVNLLAHSPESGYTIFESGDGKLLAHLGHPEYRAQRLVDEYKRDVERGIKGVDAPLNISLESPQNRWRSHRNEFFRRWVDFIHEMTNKKRSQ